MLDAAGYRVFNLFKRGKSAARNATDILLVRLDHIGDVLLCASIPKIIKEHTPGVRLSFLVSSAAAPLLENNPFVDEILVYDMPGFFRQNSNNAKNKSSFFGIVREIKKKKFERAFGFRGDLRENLMFWLARIPERIGYGITGGGFFLTREVMYHHDAHESEHALDLLRAVGIKSNVVRPALYFSEKENDRFHAKFSRLGSQNGQRFVGIQIGAGSSAKEWETGLLKECIRIFLGRFQNFGLVLTGTDAHQVRDLEVNSHPRIMDLVGKTTLREFAWLAGRLAAFIGPDSGPTHIAAGWGVPTVFLYSGTNVFAKWRPLYENARVLRHEVPCAPCGLKVCNVKGHPCMNEITPGQVINVLLDIL